MSTGSTLSPAWCSEWGWSSSLRCPWAASRDLCLIFPSFLPPALSSDQQLCGAPSWLQAKQDQPGTVLLFCAPSFPGCFPSIPVLPWLLPIPLPDPAVALAETLSASSISCCFFWRKGCGSLIGIVPWLTSGAASSFSLGAAMFLFLHIQGTPTCGI